MFSKEGVIDGWGGMTVVDQSDVRSEQQNEGTDVRSSWRLCGFGLRKVKMWCGAEIKGLKAESLFSGKHEEDSRCDSVEQPALHPVLFMKSRDAVGTSAGCQQSDTIDFEGSCKNPHLYSTEPKLRWSLVWDEYKILSCSSETEMILMLSKFLFFLFSFFNRGNVSNQETEGEINFQKSTGALISDKDRELETLRNEVLTCDFNFYNFFETSVCYLSVWGVYPFAPSLQIAVLRGENAMAKTLQSAVETLQRDKAQLQSRVHSLEQRLGGTQASEGDNTEAPPSGEETIIRASTSLWKHVLFFLLTSFCFWCSPAGDAALEQLREEKEFAEGQVRPSGRFLKFILAKSSYSVLSLLVCVSIVSIRSTSWTVWLWTCRGRTRSWRSNWRNSPWLSSTATMEPTSKKYIK